MSDGFAGTFDLHEIRSSVVQEHFGSWLLMRRTRTAADGLLRVSGDFDPIIFRGHLSYNDDPVARVAWMGSHPGLDSYVCEKARAGSGRDACTQWSVEDARADLHELIRERETELEDAARERYGDDEDEWPDDDLCCESLNAMQDGLDASLLHDGRQGVEEMINAIYESEWGIDMEMVHRIGARPSQGLKLAHLAVQRLYTLLSGGES